MDGMSATTENTPESRPKYAIESTWSGVKTSAEGRTVATEGLKHSMGVNAAVLDSCGGPVSTMVGSVVNGKMATIGM